MIGMNVPIPVPMAFYSLAAGAIRCSRSMCTAWMAAEAHAQARQPRATRRWQRAAPGFHPPTPDSAGALHFRNTMMEPALEAEVRHCSGG